MSWWVGLHDQGTGTAFVFSAPNAGAAQQEAQDTNATLAPSNPFPSDAGAMKYATNYNLKLSGKGGGGGNSGSGKAHLEVNIKIISKTGQWWVVNTSPTKTADTLTVYTVVEGTQAQALALPNGGGISGPYSTEAKAIAVANSRPLNKPVTIDGVKISPTGAASSGLGGEFATIDNFLTALENPATWIRVGKVIAGALLILLGINKLTGSSTKIENIAGKLPKVIPV